MTEKDKINIQWFKLVGVSLANMFTPPIIKRDRCDKPLTEIQKRRRRVVIMNERKECIKNNPINKLYCDLSDIITHEKLVKKFNKYYDKLLN